MSTVCAIIPTYNRAHYIGECLNSLLAQTRRIDQIIVVDDGSTDNTQEVLKAYAGQIIVLHKQNGGKASALNLGMQHCTSDYVWICDDDDIAAPGGLQVLASALDTDEKLDIVFGRYQTFSDDDPPGVYHESDYWARTEEPDHKINFLEGMFTNQFAMLVRTNLYAQTGLFREDMLRSQDFEMITRLMRHSRAAYIPHTIFYYRQHAGIRGSNLDSFNSAQNTSKWLTYEQKVLVTIRDSYSLIEFCPSFARTLPISLQTRASYLERALIFANRALWQDALCDLSQASLQDTSPATDDELTLASNVIRTILPWQKLNDMPEQKGILKEMISRQSYTRQIVLSLISQLVREIKKLFLRGQLLASWKLMRLLGHVIGYHNLPAALWHITNIKLRKKRQVT